MKHRIVLKSFDSLSFNHIGLPVKTTTTPHFELGPIEPQISSSGQDATDLLRAPCMERTDDNSQEMGRDDELVPPWRHRFTPDVKVLA